MTKNKKTKRNILKVFLTVSGITCVIIGANLFVHNYFVPKNGMEQTQAGIAIGIAIFTVGCLCLHGVSSLGQAESSQ